MTKCPPAHGVPAGIRPSAFTKARHYALRKSQELRLELYGPSMKPPEPDEPEVEEDLE